MPAHIMVIVPYWLEKTGVWVFDDPGAGVQQEPFVSGTPEMIDDLVKAIPDARNGFRLLFSSMPFPGYQKLLAWKREERDGHWYASNDPPSEGWLSSVLVRYFDRAPALLYVKAESKQQQTTP
jgi:hypothetical protein